MIMILRRRQDPVNQLVDRLREVAAQLRVDAYGARRAAEAHQKAASDQIDRAESLATETDDIATSLEASEGGDDA